VTATVAYLVLAHEANEQLFRLTNALLADKRSRVYLHLDAKLFDVGWTEFHGDPRLVVLLNRVEVNWNDYSVVEATLALLHRALTDSTNERFVLLSGSCFPLMPIGTLNNDILKSIAPMISVCGRIDASLTQDEAPEHDVVAKLRLYDRTVLTIKNHTGPIRH